MTRSRILIPVAALMAAAPGSDEPVWQDYALCAESDPDAWHPEKGGPTRLPKAICRRCPVRVPCLRFALDGPELYGIWAGFTAEERLTAAREREQGVSLEDIIDAADEALEAKRAAAIERAERRAA